ncbi:PucR family transcriptional regulator [Nocardioides sambongensis]|uniref:PucR family transcriptional regulator n=1 Tax=Nocardioides sambongensis TaxID=2589074 RepID=UPI00112ECDF6|nr:helix-turn-helix domain-containing protein [Nocardioides sambongensis]
MSALLASPRTLDYVAAVANHLLADAEQLIADLNRAVADGAPALADDPAIVDDTAASNRLTVLHFLHAVAARPEHPVSVYAPPELVQKARNLVRRGVDLDVVIQAYRFGQEALWRHWMDTAAELVEHDPAELAGVLRHSADLLFTYVNGCLALEVSQIQQQREQISRSGSTRQAEVIRLLLDAAPLSRTTANQWLGYDVGGPHTFLALWGSRSIEDAALESAASELASVLGLRSAGLRAGAGQLWTWLGGEITDRAAFADAHAALETPVNVLVGPPGRGADGFRRTQQRAIEVQRFAMSEESAPPALTWYDELGPVALTADDPERVRVFVADALGRLAEDDPALDDLRATMLVFLQEGESAPKAAQRLFTHRNTVLQRVGRATGLIGAPLAERRLQVFLALELVHRLGRSALTPPN